ncbi:MAG: hypothetical protein BWY66_02767 [bacterium ADurb.Bin374]|nr:MAG: hypothetical protein BWY66_02767 [bacterium ADurb.Bin374]
MPIALPPVMKVAPNGGVSPCVQAAFRVTLAPPLKIIPDVYEGSVSTVRVTPPTSANSVPTQARRSRMTATTLLPLKMVVE